MSQQRENGEKILVTRSSMPSYEEYIEMIKPIWDSAWLTNMGDFHKRLEQELKDYMGISNLVLFVNGHMALEMAIQALNLTGEVITTPFTFASTTHAIVRNGLTPVFCDINPLDYTCLLYTSDTGSRSVPSAPENGQGEQLMLWQALFCTDLKERKLCFGRYGD